MKKTFTKFLSAAIILISVSCEKSSTTQEEPAAYNPNAKDLSNLFEKNLNDLRQFRTITLFDAIHHGIPNGFTSKNNARLLVMENSYKTINNEDLTGDVNLTFIEMYDAGTMLSTNKPTVTMLDNKRKPLATEGQFFLNIKQANGVELKTRDNFSQISIYKSSFNLLDNSMKKQTGNIDQEGNIIWEKSEKDLYITDELQEEHSYTLTFGEKWGWLSIAKEVNPSVNFIAPANIKRPNGFNKDNSKIFVILKGTKPTLADENTYLPEDSEGYFVLLAATNDKFIYSIKPSQKIKPDQQIEFKNDEIKVATTQELVKEINNLR